VLYVHIVIHLTVTDPHGIRITRLISFRFYRLSYAYLFSASVSFWWNTARLSYNSYSKYNRNRASILVSFHGNTTRIRERKIIFVNKYSISQNLLPRQQLQSPFNCGLRILRETVNCMWYITNERSPKTREISWGRGATQTINNHVCKLQRTRSLQFESFYWRLKGLCWVMWFSFLSEFVNIQVH
jgi:hypothetical protein